jgi:hypothetical protein
MTHDYDVVIVGGGIAGLYTAHCLLNLNKKRILILEKENTIGGRIFTYSDEHMRVEAGAGRFHGSHQLLFNLIREMDLHDKIKLIQSNPSYIDVTNGVKYPEVICNTLINNVIRESKKHSSTFLRQRSFIKFAKTVLSPDEIEYIENSFGFSTEFYHMNAYDAVILMKTLIGSKIISGDQKREDFFYLSGGLSQLTENLKKKIESRGCHIKTGCLVESIYHSASADDKINKKYVVKYKTSRRDDYKIFADNIILALPKQNLKNISLFFHEKKSILIKEIENDIYCGSLCRIYTKFKDGKWFRNLSRFTTQNDLRMVIPMDPTKGTMMISYSDNTYADRWNKYHEKHGMRMLKNKLRELLSECLSFQVPPLGVTRIFYWKCGVGYWAIGANSKKISKEIVKPFSNENVFICGEHYSDNNQQWMEGALETSSRVVKHF